MQLEWLAAEAAQGDPYPMAIERQDGALILDTRPLIRAVVQDVRAGSSAPLIARRFHGGLADGIASICERIRDVTGFTRVVLTGGVFLNAVLTQECTDRLTRAAFEVHRHHLVPPNDGGLSLGQLAVAAARLETDD